MAYVEPAAALRKREAIPCRRCGTRFHPSRAHVLYCGQECRRAVEADRKRAVAAEQQPSANHQFADVEVIVRVGKTDARRLRGCVDRRELDVLTDDIVAAVEAVLNTRNGG